ncbi:sigma-54-dependent transcriptional regulator [Maridesulfovibrio frigidus]|uniref:sigma-54-dependent transcriptional regulator n=1 Tax=Maridesulfovibrio frigidus TaxID=340956 RepID=UPI0004E1E3D2|nr:response regulator [Maridesulfovibrio frigidus]
MTKKMNVLIVEDDSIDALFFKHALTKAGYDVSVADGPAGALDALSLKNYGLLLVDLKMAEMGGIELLDIAKRYYPQVEVIIITAHASVDTAVQAMRKGASSYFVKGDPVEKLIADVGKCEKISGEDNLDASDVHSDMDYCRLKTRGAHLSRVLNLADHFAKTRENLLIVGQTGTGRKALAKHIHSKLKNRMAPFFEIDIPALSCEDCNNAHYGDVLEEAGKVYQSCGTLYLKDVGKADSGMFAEFLCNIEKNVALNSFNSPGMVISSSAINDVLVLKNRFGLDLFFNYWSLRVELPSLEDRREDIPILIPEICAFINAKLGTNVEGVDYKLMKELSRVAYVDDFAGLEQLLFRLIRNAESGTLSLPHLNEVETSDVLRDKHFPVGAGEPSSLKEVRMQAEAEFIKIILSRTGGNKKSAAIALGVSSRQLYNMLKKYGLN